MEPLNLNIELKGVDTSYPTLAVGDYRVNIEGIELKESSATPGLQMLNVKLETLEPANTSRGKLVHPPFKFNTNIVLPGGPAEATEKLTAEELQELRLKNLCIFVDAVFNTTDETRPTLNGELINQMIGKQVIVKIKKSKDDTYGDTQVSGFKALQGVK